MKEFRVLLFLILVIFIPTFAGDATATAHGRRDERETATTRVQDRGSGANDAR